MSTLRRRIFGAGTPDSTPDVSRDSSPAPPSLRTKDGTADDNYKVVAAEKLEKLRQRAHQKGRKRRNAWIFGLGGLFGIFIAGFFASNNGGLEKLVEVAGFQDMGLESFLDVLPTGLIRDIQDMQSHEKDAVNYDSFAVGLHARSQGIEAKYPVIMIPGVISTGLESWGTEGDSIQYFRKRLWGSWSMMRALVLDKAAWKRHVMLDPHTGLDPPGIKLRSAQGFDAADFFITGYWIWNKILENLATVGYDPTNAFTAAYDWRMSYQNYEIRDQYFTRLKNHIEVAKHISGRKVVLLSHSMGSQVLYYFFHWVEASGDGYGNGGSSWVNDHVESWINISGCMLGATKDVPAVLSGEMRDTAQLNAFAVYGLEKFLSRHERAQIFRHMPGISSMLPIGGEAVWGNSTWAPDDQPDQNVTFGNFISFRNNQNHTSHETRSNLTVGGALPYLWEHTEDWYTHETQKSYSQGVAHTKEEVERNQHIPSKWLNPLETRLPVAPDMKIFCFYGIGKPTERAYFYRPDTEPVLDQHKSKPRVMIDTSVSSADGFVDRGVVMGEGDGTVNLLSSGYMCNKGWNMQRYNPGNVSVTTYEMPHEPDRFNPRGGPNTGDHVDILGRSSLNDLILRVVGGKGHLISDNVVSNIKEYAERVKIYDDDDERNPGPSDDGAN
ncbi:LACT-domain-containing protein [Hortaea werneckii]|uniref:Phospholipid:diacylglycerol acyltransferase n=1 Tax=Hortaea werneckii TaxID=91943 RepID=A0A3M7G3I2_HORWE|nr:LACT-domain-containing protein [Hortaea werneckii]KAI6882931.1 LACT-domain-containing protein [Hortaea werneckii]KAI6991825.1 LACT-domain-containing protein [Hortaea werneckii]KAI7144461.1 LACT-domain-containing protein [Hortaea werneckii]KAI7172533.1 LACT-domain-containing protein [Hortaea werneckii]